MITRTLGSQGLVVSAIGLGCMGMSMAYGERDDKESIATLNHAIDCGVNFIDTADMYGNGANETLIGPVIARRRSEVLIATKFGNRVMPDGSRSICGRPDYVKTACDASLQRLGIETIDLYYQHRVDADVPIEETVGAMSDLITAGKVRYLGLSEAGPDTLRRGHAEYPLSALQTEYSLWTRDVETEILPLCQQLGIGFVPYSPLGRGFLSATIRQPEDLIDQDRRHDHPRFQEENFNENLKLLPVLEDVAKAHDATPAQIAIAWLLARYEQIVPIPGTKRRHWLDQNIAAVDIQLSAQTIAQLDEHFKPGMTSGLRYPPGQMKQLGR